MKTASSTVALLFLFVCLVIVIAGATYAISVAQLSTSSGSSTPSSKFVPMQQQQQQQPQKCVEQKTTTTFGRNTTSSRPPLVRYRNLTQRPCRNNMHATGKWVYNPDLKVPRYPSYGEVLGSCARNVSYQNRKELYYEWTPSTCDLHSWSEELFCKALDGRDIMFAGDSMQDHWHASLYYLLGGRGDIYSREGQIAGKMACQTHKVCHKYYPKPLKIYHLTNQYLAMYHYRNRNHPWGNWISKYPIIILNSGSWMRDVMDETAFIPDSDWMKFMETAAAHVRDTYNGTVIWRTTFQGHPNCWEYTEPLTEEIKTFPTVAPYLRYRWDIIPLRNGFTTQLFQSIGAHILDVARVTNLMPMGHLGKYHPKFVAKGSTDCLHYCSPGVYDTWSILLMNMLLGN
eukprot:PhF_6_TR15036/c0_g1_i1/m.23595